MVPVYAICLLSVKVGIIGQRFGNLFFSNIKKRKFVIILNVKCNLYFNCGLFGFFLGAAYTQVFTVVVVFGKDQLVGVATFGTFYCL